MENFNFEVLDDDCIEINGTEIDLHTVPLDRLETMHQRYKKKSEDDEDLFSWEGYYAAATEAIERVLKYRRENPQVDLSPEDLLEAAREADEGTEVVCPQCKKKFTKSHPQQAFCSNGRSDARHNCKDRYWNLHDPKRKARLDSIHENYS